MMRRPAALLLTLLVAAFALAACGGDDETTSTTEDTAASTTETTEASTTEAATSEFATQADEICSSADAEINEAGAELGQQPSEKELTAFVEDTLVPSITAQVDEIEALEPPEGQEELVDEFITEARAGIDELAADPGQVNTGGDPFVDTRAVAQELGLAECAQ